MSDHQLYPWEATYVKATCDMTSSVDMGCQKAIASNACELVDVFRRRADAKATVMPWLQGVQRAPTPTVNRVQSDKPVSSPVCVPSRRAQIGGTTGAVLGQT